MDEKVERIHIFVNEYAKFCENLYILYQLFVKQKNKLKIS